MTMENALFIGLDQQSHKGESSIHEHQRSTGCTYEAAIAHKGYTLYARIVGKLFRSCELYIKKGNTFCGGYIDVVFHPLSGSNKPIHQFIYADEFLPWIGTVNTLASNPGSSIHRIGHDSEVDQTLGATGSEQEE
jgi:hypothetical protein